MALGKRPGGLTALAVLNFVFGGIGLIMSALAFLGLSLIKEGIAKAEAMGGKYDGPSITMAQLTVGLSVLSAILLITAGVGYIKQKRFTGRTLGNVYALVSLGGTVLAVATGASGIGAVLFAIYPLITLALINSSFKSDLVN